jgi:hypothetical protein
LVYIRNAGVPPKTGFGFGKMEFFVLERESRGCEETYKDSTLREINL